MQDVFLIYNGCCFYEIVILSYFLNFSHCELCFCSPDGKAVQAMEGFTVNANVSLEGLSKADIRSFIVPGGKIFEIDTQAVHACLRELRRRDTLIAGICAGVDVLDHAGVLRGVRSTHSKDEDCVADGNVITARANAYVDFAVETAKKLGLFESDADLQETLGFWKHYKRVQ